MVKKNLTWNKKEVHVVKFVKSLLLFCNYTPLWSLYCIKYIPPLISNPPFFQICNDYNHLANFRLLSNTSGFMKACTLVSLDFFVHVWKVWNTLSLITCTLSTHILSNKTLSKIWIFVCTELYNSVNIRMTQNRLDISREDDFFLPTNGNRQIHTKENSWFKSH